MSRSFLSTMNRIAREAERNARTRERAQERIIRESVRQDKLANKQAKQDYIESRLTETAEANSRLSSRLAEIQSILAVSLTRDPRIDFNTFVRYPSEQDLDSDRSLVVPQESRLEVFLPRKPRLLEQLVPGFKRHYSSAVADAEARFAAYQSRREDVLRRRNAAMAALKAAADENNRQVREASIALQANDPDAVRSYFELMLGESPFPAGFTKNARLAYIPESKQLAFDYQLPTIEDVIPSIEKYKYIKSTDEIAETKKSDRQRQSLYVEVVAQTVLRCLNEVFTADALHQVDVTTLNGFVDTIDPGTGRNVKPYIISVRTTRDEFCGLELQNVAPTACLKRLSAAISPSPAEFVAVRPIMDLNMVDPRFIQEQDVLSTLDNRPNLMELSPGEFESLITNLFQKMGLETKLTQASRDGGVDCVAFDARPILGGKVIVQAKRYKNTVGVAAVRDLFGTIHNEGASKGIPRDHQRLRKSRL
jgi:restriction system protein